MIDALRRELDVLMEGVDVQRVEALEVFSAELAGLIDAIDAELMVAIEALSAERAAVIDAAAPLMQDAIDHAVRRVGQLMAAMGVFVALLVGAVVFALRRDRRSAGV